jgi:hypothetical protein
MPRYKYHVQHYQQLIPGSSGSKIVYYQGDNTWTTEHDHRKIYTKKADATQELYDFGGKVIRDSLFDPNLVNIEFVNVKQ